MYILQAGDSISMNRYRLVCEARSWRCGREVHRPVVLIADNKMVAEVTVVVHWNWWSLGAPLPHTVIALLLQALAATLV